MGKITRTYAYNNLAGCVIQQQNEDTGVAVGIYCAEQAGIDADGPWVTICERHGTICSHSTQQKAREAIALVEWCEACQDTDMLKFVRMLFSLNGKFYQTHLFVGRNREHAFQLASRWSLNGLQGCLFSAGDQKDCFRDGQLVKAFEMYFRGESPVILTTFHEAGLRVSILEEIAPPGFSCLIVSPHTTMPSS